MPAKRYPKDKSIMRQTSKIVEAYDNGKSALDIAKEFGTYVQNIYRILIKQE